MKGYSPAMNNNLVWGFLHIFIKSASKHERCCILFKKLELASQSRFLPMSKNIIR